MKSSKAKNGGSKFGKNLSLKDIYVGEIDTTIELDTGGPKAANDFFNSYYVRDEEELNEFLVGKKCFVYGQKGAGKTAFLRYVGESLARDKPGGGGYALYRFPTDFPSEAHKDITQYISAKRQAGAASDGVDMNIFRDIDYEELWTFIILERVADFLSHDGKDRVVDNADFSDFLNMFAQVDRGSIIDRFLRLVPARQYSGKSTPTSLPASKNLTISGGQDDLEKFTAFVDELKVRFNAIKWVKGPLHFMFDEIDPRVGSGKAFDLDCILIRDLIIAIYKLNASVPFGGVYGHEKPIVFSAAVRSEVLKSVEKLGKEVHKVLTQLGIHMNWGEYGSLDISHPLVRMICKKLEYSEMRQGIYNVGNPPTDWAMWSKYFKKSTTEEMSIKEIFNLTWFRPRDLVRLLKIAKGRDQGAKYFSVGLIDQSKQIYANQSWNEIQSQMVTAFSPREIQALELVLMNFVDEFRTQDFERRVAQMAIESSTVAELKNRKIGDIFEVLYLNGVVGNKDGNFQRFFFRGDISPYLQGGFVIHVGLRKKFKPMYGVVDRTFRRRDGELDLG